MQSIVIAAQDIAHGYLEANISVSSEDEIGILIIRLQL